jgi:hypothetical protein
MKLREAFYLMVTEINLGVHISLVISIKDKIISRNAATQTLNNGHAVVHGFIKRT